MRGTERGRGGWNAAVGDDVMSVGSGGCGFIITDCVLIGYFLTSKIGHDWEGEGEHHFTHRK